MRKTVRGAACLVALVSAGVALSLPASVTAKSAPDLARTPTALRTVPMADRPKWRWWWPSGTVDNAELDRELQSMKAAGFGGVEQTLLRSPDDWWSPAFHAAIKHAIETATSLGLTFDTTLGPEWPISSKAVDDISKGLSMQEAIFSSIDLVGPSTYTGPLPQLDDGGLTRRTLVAATAAKPVNQADLGIVNPLEGTATSPVTLDPTTAVDLTPKVRGGTLTWQVPPGRWKLVATWMRPTGQRVHGDAVTLAGAVPAQNLPVSLPDLGGQLGPLVPDHFSRAATDATLQDYDNTLFGGDMAVVMRHNGGHVFEDSLELTHNALGSTPISLGSDGCLLCSNRFWTPAFLAEFKKRRGYDLAPLLPAIFDAFVLPGGAQQRVRSDYYRTLSELLVDNHYKAIRAWANARGLTSRAQGYNLVGTDKTSVSTGLQLPDTESLDDGETGDDVAPGSATSWSIMDDYRSVVSAAHITGAGQVTLEAGANLLGEYDMSQADYKVIADRAYAAGVTTMALHGFAYKTYHDAYQLWSWPGWSAFDVLFAQSWNEDAPQMSLWSGLAGYYGRISAALRSGRPSVDVTVLSKQNTPHSFGTATLAAALRSASFTADRIDDASLVQLPRPKHRRLLPSGPGYRALVIDSMTAVSGAAADRVLAFAKAGLPVVVVGDAPSQGTAYRDPGAEDAQVKAAFGALLALRNVRQVKSAKDAPAALTSLHLAPQLQRGDLPIVAQHRRTKGGDVWFLYNNSTRPVAGNATFTTTGAPAQVDPWTGNATRLRVSHRRKKTVTLPLSLAGGQSTLIAFGRSAKALHVASVPRPGLPEPIVVAGPWSLAVATVGPDGSGKVGLTLDKLADWRNIPQLSSASGTGVYTAKVTLPASWLASRRAVALDPGAYGGMAQFTVNGTPAPMPSLPDGPREITRLLHPGANELQVRLATSIANVIIGRARSGDLRYAAFIKNTPQSYGLLGPVRLIGLARATL